MKAQIMYDLREAIEFCSGTDLHEFFTAQTGEPSPAGKTQIDPREARRFIWHCLDAMRHNNGGAMP